MAVRFGLRAERRRGEGLSGLSPTPVSERAQWLDLFAAALERGLPIDRAAAALGKSAAWGKQAFKDICDRLGPQAA